MIHLIELLVIIVLIGVAISYIVPLMAVILAAVGFGLLVGWSALSKAWRALWKKKNY